MSVIVKGLEMPKSCAECKPEWRSQLVSKEGARCYCRIAKQYGSLEIANQRRMDFCPLGEVPPHGRLIDADFLSKILKERAEDEWNKNTAPFSWSYAYECLIDTLDSMPTIIEAEE